MMRPSHTGICEFSMPGEIYLVELGSDSRSNHI